MSFIAIHRGEATSLATDRLWLGAEEFAHLQSAHALLQRLEALAKTRHAEAAAERAAAREEGLAEGRAQALEAVAPKLLAAWEQAAARAALDGEALRAAVVELAIGIVQRLATGLDPQTLMPALAARAAEAISRDQGAVVHVHPALAEAVQQRLADSALAVHADPSLGEFDCVFETPAGRLIAGLEHQLQRLREELS